MLIMPVWVLVLVYMGHAHVYVYVCSQSGLICSDNHTYVILLFCMQ